MAHLSRVHHAPTEGLHTLERHGEIVDGKVRQREGVAGPAPAGVHADGRVARARLPPLPLRLLAL